VPPTGGLASFNVRHDDGRALLKKTAEITPRLGRFAEGLPA
jgi:hypothetical protein